MNAEFQMACPGTEMLEKLASGTVDPELADVASHVFFCNNCQRRLGELIYPRSGSSLTDEEKRRTVEFTSMHCSHFNPEKSLRSWVLTHPPIPRFFGQLDFRDDGDWRKAALPDGSLHESRRDAEDKVRFVYLAARELNDPEFWRAEITIAATPTHLSKMSVSVCNSRRMPLEGVFSVCGLSVRLENGRGELSYADFVHGLKCSEVYLEPSGGRRIYGTLVFL